MNRPSVLAFLKSLFCSAPEKRMKRQTVFLLFLSLIASIPRNWLPYYECESNREKSVHTKSFVHASLLFNVLLYHFSNLVRALKQKTALCTCIISSANITKASICCNSKMLLLNEDISNLK